MNIDFPYRFDSRGRTARASTENHVRDLIEQIVFTAPGERVNRPDFGSGLMRLVFEGASEELAATTQFLVEGALQQFAGELIEVNQVEVRAEDSTLRVTVQYVIRETQQPQIAQFTRGGTPT
jgi:hypothetical protein